VANFIKQNLIVLDFSQTYSKILSIPKSAIIFSLASVIAELLTIFFDFSLNKSCKTHLGPMLPPGGRNGQLISSHYSNKESTLRVKLYKGLHMGRLQPCPQILDQSETEIIMTVKSL
jgi:hypothetical protein